LIKEKKKLPKRTKNIKKKKSSMWKRLKEKWQLWTKMTGKKRFWKGKGQKVGLKR
jgi:hypothetical protein